MSGTLTPLAFSLSINWFIAMNKYHATWHLFMMMNSQGRAVPTSVLIELGTTHTQYKTDEDWVITNEFLYPTRNENCCGGNSICTRARLSLRHWWVQNTQKLWSDGMIFRKVQYWTGKENQSSRMKWFGKSDSLAPSTVSNYLPFRSNSRQARFVIQSAHLCSSRKM